MTMPPPRSAQRLTTLESRNLVVEAKGPVYAEIEYRMGYIAHDKSAVHTQWKRYTLETLGDDWEDYNQQLVMQAIDLGLGTEILQATIASVLPMTTDPVDIYLPLFVVAEDERSVRAEFVLGKHPNNKHYGRLGMRLFTSSPNLTMNAPSYSRAGDVFADLGFVSSSWTIRLVIDAAAQWFAVALNDLDESDYAPIINACGYRKHKFNAQVKPTHRELIEMLVTGTCSKCHSIEWALSADVPF